MNRDRRMMLNSTGTQQLQSLPLPAAALVIDVRGDNDVIAMLEGEIKNLASDMNMQQIDHWRYLTTFIDVLSLNPLTLDQVKALRHEEDKQQQTRSATGRYHKGSHKLSPGNYYEEEDIEPSFVSQIPDDQFKRDIEDCIRRIDMVRNNRFKAVGDMQKRGYIGANANNPKVQVIFLADERRKETLSSAAAYAAYLKDVYKGLESTGEPVLDTTIICLNHDNQSNPPRLLISRLGWKKASDPADSDIWQHIDSLFLCERYGHNAVRIPESTQPYLAELLLYTLLISPPLQMRPEPPETSHLFTPPPNTQESKKLPVNTYLVGLNAIEYSGRWGRRYLNYSLVTEIIRTLKDTQYDTSSLSKNAVSTWLRYWRIEIRKAVPDEIDGNITVLQAFQHSASVASATDEVLASNPLALDTGNKSLKAFDKYADAVAQTYLLSDNEQEAVWKKQPSRFSNLKTSDSEQLTLENAITCAPAIVHQLQTWQPGDPEMPLVRAQQDAQRILSHPDFFPRSQDAARGAIPRAKQQLGDLSLATKKLQDEQRKQKPNLAEQHDKLIETKESIIANIQERKEQFPFFAGLLKGKSLLTALTLILTLGLVALALIITFAWLNHFLHAIAGLNGFMSAMDSGIILELSLYKLISWGIIIGVLAWIVIASIKNSSIQKKSALSTEIYFWLALIAYPILGLIVDLSAGLQQSDRVSYAYLEGITNLPFWSLIILFIAIVILLVEIIYYLQWHNGLRRDLVNAVQTIKQHQQQTSDLVKNHLADTVMLMLLHRAELTDGNGQPGAYYRRIDNLLSLLNSIEGDAAQIHQVAMQRLSIDQQDAQLEKKPQLEIRTEILDVGMLTKSSKRIRNAMNDNKGPLATEFNEFVEILLRTMSTEPPVQIEQHIQDQQADPSQLSFPQDQQQRHAQILLSSIVALALRVEIDPAAVINITHLKERYHQLNYRTANTLEGLQSLLLRLEQEAGQETSRSQNPSGRTSPSRTMGIDDQDLADYALLIWCQSLWEHRDLEVSRLLEAKSITEYLQRENYDPQTVKGILGARTVISGRSVEARQLGELSLLMFPSQEGNHFFEDMALESRFVGIPDMERLILLYIHQYVAPTHFTVKVAEEVEVAEEDQLDNQNINDQTGSESSLPDDVEG